MSKQTKKELEYKINNLDCDNYKLTEKVKKRNWCIIFLIIFFISVTLFMRYNKLDINESDFCLKKLQENFPEFDFKEAHYYSGKCNGDYYEKENTLKRDGLEEVKQSKELTKTFKLIDVGDIEYLRSDDFNEIKAILSIILGVITGFFSAVILLFIISEKYNIN